jgi:hypothetical protein
MPSADLLTGKVRLADVAHRAEGWRAALAMNEKAEVHHNCGEQGKRSDRSHDFPQRRIGWTGGNL